MEKRDLGDERLRQVRDRGSGEMKGRRHHCLCEMKDTNSLYKLEKTLKHVEGGTEGAVVVITWPL